MIVGMNILQKESRESEPGWVGHVLRFWFQEMPSQAWFVRDEAVDSEIGLRFSRLHSTLVDQAVLPPLDDSRTALARIIVLDQFPRNMFRGTADAFVTDRQALAVAKSAVAAGLDRGLDGPSRLFMYLPFEHSEEPADQKRAVDLVSAIGNAEYTRFAQAHKAIIDRFGRFPHRNAALGRPSTDEEIAFLAQPGSSF